MPHVSWNSWPLVEVDANETPADVGRRYLMDVLVAALERGGEFAVVVVLPDQAERPRGGSGLMQLLRTHRSGLRERCRGIAFVMTPDVGRRAQKVIKVGSRIMGCPTAAEYDIHSGRSWAAGQLVAAGLTVPGIDES